MAISKSWNGKQFKVPEDHEKKRTWGAALSAFLQDLADNALARFGGEFNLTGADVEWGPDYGHKMVYLKSNSSDIAQTGVIRLSHTDLISFRNAANTADISFAIDSNNKPTFGGLILGLAGDTDALDTRIDGLENAIDSRIDGLEVTLDTRFDAIELDVTTLENAASSKLDVTGGVANSLRINDFMEFDEETAPATPASGKLRLFVASDKKFYQKDSSGLVKNLGGGGAGSGEKNYSSDGSNDVTGWLTSGVGMTVTTETNPTLLPDNITQTTGIKFLRVSGSDYAYKRFTLDKADYGRVLKQTLDQAYAGSAGDYSVRLFSNTLSNYLGTSTEISLSPTTAIPSGIGPMPQKSFTTPNASAPYLEVRIYGNSGTTPLYVNNFLVGPGVIGSGSAGGTAIAFVPIIGNGTNLSILNAKYRRVFDWAEGFVSIAAIGTGSGGLITVTTPFPIDLTVAPVGSTVGAFRFFDSGVNNFTGAAVVNSSTTLALQRDGIPSSMLGTDLNINDALHFDFSVPIADWAGSGTVNMGAGAQQEYVFNNGGNVSAGTAASAANSVFGPEGALIGAINSTTGGNSTTSFPVVFSSPVQPDEEVILEIKDANGWKLAAGSMPPVSLNTTIYGVSLSAASPTQYVVTFGNGGYSPQGAATYAASGGAWSALTNWRWRVRKVKASSPVGFGLVKSYEAGLQAPRTVQKTNSDTTNPIVVTSAQAGFSIIRAVCIAYSDINGIWRLKFNFAANFTSAALPVSGGLSATIAGVTFKNLANFSQACSLLFNNNSGPVRAFVVPNSGTLSLETGAAITTSLVSVSGDVELESKPTWA